MKRIIVLLFIPYILFSQELNEYRTKNFTFLTPFKEADIKHYESYSESLNEKLDQILSLKNNKDLREIVILKNLESYHNYLKLLDIPLRDDFIFLKFSDNRSRVVLYSVENIDYATIAHHLTLQYIDFYGGETPEWFSLGLSVYFEDFLPGKEFIQSNKWLSTLKKSPQLNSIYNILLNSTTDDVKPYFAWILIDYLIETDNKEHNRLFWDSLSLLKYDISSDKKDTLTQMYKNNNLNNELLEYINSKKSYNDYMDLGIEAYQNKNFEKALDHFKESIILEQNNYSPEYYIGLCYSSLKKYNEAYSHFSSALDKGAPKDIVYYSIGINFYSNKNFQEAKKYLSKIEDKMYQVMSEKILNEISKY